MAHRDLHPVPQELVDRWRSDGLNEASTDLQQNTVSDLHPGQLFHVGVVAEDIDAAMREMSANLGLTWKGGFAKQVELCLEGGERRTMEMRIAHSVQGPPHVELIQSVPDTPWHLASAGVHHLCYWSADSAAVVQALEGAGNRRILGEAGAASGYFQAPSGAIIEIIDAALHDHLSSWITRVPQ